MDDNKQYETLAKKVLADNQYFTLSTMHGDTPWGSTVTYVHDERYNFYFMSEPSSRHVQDTNSDNRVSATIYDSRQQWGEGLGLQIQGTVTKVSVKETPKVIKLFFGRDYPYGGVPEVKNIFREAIDSKIYYFYMLEPTEIWVTDPTADVDGRVLVNLKGLD